MVRRPHGSRVSALALLAVVACGDDLGDGAAHRLASGEEALATLPPEPVETPLAPLPPEPDDVVTATPWSPVGVGVSFKAMPGRRDVLVVYGGYKADDLWVQRWSNALVRARGEALSFGAVYAVRGPNQSAYANREIQNSKLVAHLAAGGHVARANHLHVVAHSSGTFVADELLSMMAAGAGGVAPGVLAKLRLYSLDGGGVGSASTLQRLARAYFVFACDDATRRCSRNAASMRRLGDRFIDLGGPVEIDATGSGCSPTSDGGLWCLHDTVVNTRPFNPDMYDLARDYSVFSGDVERRVVTAYFDAP